MKLGLPPLQGAATSAPTVPHRPVWEEEVWGKDQ